WYYHCGYREVWNRPLYNDPGMKRSFDEYFREACDKGWWELADEQARDSVPRFLIEVGGNLLRRQRGGARVLLEHLWPKLETTWTGASTRPASTRITSSRPPSTTRR
ncbi:MAG: hypothetical protein ACYSWT_16645, partial [Planctomycetota bacterium]